MTSSSTPPAAKDLDKRFCVETGIEGSQSPGGTVHYVKVFFTQEEIIKDPVGVVNRVRDQILDHMKYIKSTWIRVK